MCQACFEQGPRHLRKVVGQSYNGVPVRYPGVIKIPLPFALPDIESRIQSFRESKK